MITIIDKEKVFNISPPKEKKLSENEEKKNLI